MEHNCEECKSWQQHMYWSHAETKQMRFFKVLLNDFKEQLRIPKKFVINFDELCDEVKLQGPSGIKWNAKVKKCSDGNTCLTQGWDEFVKDHMLELGDFLVFKYVGDKCFKVIIFGKTGCEKENSYFAKNNRCNKDCGADKEQIVKEEIESQDSPSLGSSRFHKKVGRGKRKQTQKPTSDNEHEDKPFIEKVRKGILFSQSLLSTVNNNISEETKKIIILAVSMQTNHPAFLSVMRAGSVSQNFSLVIPSAFVTENLPNHNRIVVLHCSTTRKWLVKYHIGEKSTKFTSGWKSFVQDNNLKEDDVCVFELVCTEENKLVMKVNIFRVPLPVVEQQMKMNRTYRKTQNKRRRN